MFARLQRLGTWQILLIYILVAVLIRLPFFFRDYIDHDESTFILMGQALVDGYLPYTHLWDLKPPLVFYFFAGIISIFGKSFIAIRLIGSIIVALTAWFTFRTSNLLVDKTVGFFAGLITIYLLSLFGAMQGLMSEHLAALPLVMAVYYLIKNQSYSSLFWSGFLFGTAIMFRLNLAYAVFVVYAFIVFHNGLNAKGITKGFMLTVGSFMAYFLTFLPYFITGNSEILFTSVFEASLAYSDTSLNSMMKTLPLLVGFLVVCALSWKFIKPRRSFADLMIIIVMIIGQSFMFFKSGKINGHYLIQVFPFVVILVTALIAKIPLGKKIIKLLPALLLVLFILLPVESYLEIGTLYKSYRENGTLYNGEGNTVPAYLKEKFGTEKPKNIMFLNEHIGYWTLDTYPPTSIATHPSNLFRATAYPFVENAHANAEEELGYILNKIQPNFIVYDERRIPVDKESSEYKILQDKLSSAYLLEEEFGDRNQVKLFRKNSLSN